VDNRDKMSENFAWRAYNMKCLDAVAITVLSLANTPNAEVVLCTFGEAGAMLPVRIMEEFDAKKKSVLQLKSDLLKVSAV
jgi:uncharacterized protein